MVLLTRLFSFIAKISSYFCIGYLLLLVMIPTRSVIGRQESMFINGVLYLIGAAILTVIFAKRRIKFIWGDLIVFLLLTYIILNYYIISEVQVGTSFTLFTYLVLLYIAFRIILPAYPRINKFLLVIIMLGGIYVAFIGLKQALGLERSNHHLYATTGTFFNPGPYGGYLAIILSMALFYMVKHYNGVYRLVLRYKGKEKLFLLTKPWFITYILCSLAFSISFIVFISTLSRSAWLAFLISGGIILLTYNSYYHKFIQLLKRKKIHIITIFAVLVIVIVGLWSIYSLKRTSADGRFLMWKVSSNIIKENPCTGTGVGSYIGVYSKYQAAYFNNNPNPSEIYAAGTPEYAFNEYLKVGAETGFFSLLIIVGLLLYCLIRLYKKQSVFTYGLMSLAIFALSSYPLSLLPFQILLVLFIASSFSDKNYTLYKSPSVRLLIVSFLIIGMIYGILLIRPFREIIQNTNEQSIIQTVTSNNKTQFLQKEYALMYPFLYSNSEFLFNYGKFLYSVGDYKLSIQILEAAALYGCEPMYYNVIGNNYKSLGKFELAEKNYKYAYDILPNRMYPLFLLMKLYDENNQIEKAEKMAETLINFKPKVVSPATDEIKEEAEKLLLRYKQQTY